MAILKELLTDKLRPKTFEQIILLDRIKKLFPEGQLTQNILLSGNAGSGKCVEKNTYITVRDMKTNEIKKIKIIDLI